MSSILLMRHGAHSDVGHRLTGRGGDFGLTDEGVRQVGAACEQLASLPLGRIISSPQRRTRETARLVADRFAIPCAIDQSLDEIEFGAWTGQSFDALDYDPRWQEWNAARATARCPGGESMAEAQARAWSLVEALLQDGDDQTILLVTHCDIIRALLCKAEHRSLDGILDQPCAPASLTPLPVAALEIA